LGVHVSRVCLALFVPLSGFDYPLSGLLLPKPLDRFSDPSVPGIPPFRVFLPSKSVSSLEASCSLAVFLVPLNEVVLNQPRLQSFVPFEEPFLQERFYTNLEDVTLLGFSISEAFSPPTLASPSRRLLFCTFLLL
jgi:hypothetical protein